MLKLYDNLSSGNGYKVRLFLHQLETPFQLIEKDILQGETRTPEFLAMNPNGRIPLLELEDGRLLPESNAILHYLAEGTPFLPEDRFERAQVLMWMFFEQYSHEPNVATPIHWLKNDLITPERQGIHELKVEQGHAALGVMEEQLAQRDYLVGGRYTIADIALYSYTHMAGEWGFKMENYPAVGHWLGRVAAQPRHVPITQR